jgi:hypothetical protein
MVRRVRPIRFPRYHDANHFKHVPSEPNIQRGKLASRTGFPQLGLFRVRLWTNLISNHQLSKSYTHLSIHTEVVKLLSDLLVALTLCQS